MIAFGGKDKVIEKARRLSATGNWEKAVGLLEGLLRGDSEDVPVMEEIVRIYIENQRFAEAVTWLRKLERFVKRENVIKFTLDLYYQHGSPSRIGEYLIEKYIEERDLENAAKILNELPDEDKKKLRVREKEIVENTVMKKERWGPRDLVHLYFLILFYEMEDFKKAREYLNLILERNPEEKGVISMEYRRVEREYYGNPFISIGIGEMELSEGNIEAGLYSLKRAVERNPEVINDAIEVLEKFKDKGKEIATVLADFYLKTGHQDKAFELASVLERDDALNKYREIIRKDPANIEARKRLCDLYISMERYEDALTELEHISEVEEEKEFTEVMLERIEKSGVQTYDIIYRLSEIYGKTGHPDRSAELLRRAWRNFPQYEGEIREKVNSFLKKFPEEPELLFLQGEIHVKKGEKKESVEVAEKLLFSGHTEKARRLAELIKENFPDFHQGKLLYGILWMEEPEKAQELIREALRENPKLIPLFFREMDYVLRKKQEWAPHGVKVYEALEDLNLPPFAYNFALAEAYCLAKNWERASLYYIKGLKRERDRKDFILKQVSKYLEESPEVHFILADIHLFFGEYPSVKREVLSAVSKDENLRQRAITYFTGIIKRKEDVKEFYEAVLELLSDGGYYEEVIEYGRKALEHVPEEERKRIYFYLGVAYGKTGNYRSSAELIEKGVEEEVLDKGIEYLEEFYTTSGKEPSVVHALSHLHRMKKNYERCAELLYELAHIKPEMRQDVKKEMEELVDESPVNGTVRLYRGVLMLEDGEGEGEEEIKKGLKFSPELGDSAISLLKDIRNLLCGRVLLELLKKKGKDEDALEVTLQLAEKFPEHLSEFTPVLKELGEKLELPPEKLMKICELFRKDGKNEWTAEFLEKLLEKEPGYAERIYSWLDEDEDKSIMLVRIHSVLLLGRKEEALKLSWRFLELHPQDAEKLRPWAEEIGDSLLLSALYLELGEYTRAIETIKALPLKERKEYLEKLLEKDPGMEEGRLELSYILFLEGEKEKAKENLRVLKEDSELKRVLLWSLGAGERPSLEEIERVRKKILEDKIELEEEPERRFFMLIKKGDYARAEEIAKEKKRLLPCLYERKGELLPAFYLSLACGDEDTLLRVTGKMGLSAFALALSINKGKGFPPPAAQKIIWKEVRE